MWKKKCISLAGFYEGVAMTPSTDERKGMTLVTLAGELSTQNFSGEHPAVALHWATKIWNAALENAQSNKSSFLREQDQSGMIANSLMLSQKREVEKVGVLDSPYDAGNLAPSVLGKGEL